VKIKLRKTDILYSQIIRSERPICELCKKRASSQVHHYFSRKFENTRFDDNNIVAVCFTCHRIFHGDPEKGRNFMIERLGSEEKYYELYRKKETYKKKDDTLILIWLKERAKLCQEQ